MTLGLMITAFTLGLRHGIDWDHIAAITDLTSTARNRRCGLVWSTLYAVGHGSVVFAIGAAAIVAGARLDPAIDIWMSRVVGLTLVALGIWITVDLARSGRGFRLHSRWSLALAGLRSLAARSHAEWRDQFAFAYAPLNSIREATLTDPNAPQTPTQPAVHPGRSGAATAVGVGALHGVGVESPTQIAIFVATTSATGVMPGLMVLLAWVTGLIAANMALAVLASVGFVHAERRFGVYATLAMIVAVLSIAMGFSFLFDISWLPAIELTS